MQHDQRDIAPGVAAQLQKPDRAALRQTLGTPPRLGLRLWVVIFACTLAQAVPTVAFAASVKITDLVDSEKLELKLTGAINGDKCDSLTVDLETLTCTVLIDGKVSNQTGMAVLLEDDGSLSDVLTVAIQNKGMRGNGFHYEATITFTSNGETAIDPASLGLGDDVLKKVLAKGMFENGQQQDLGARLIDTMSGDDMSLVNLTITAASDAIPEPSTVLLFGGGVVGLTGHRWRRRPRAASFRGGT